MLAGEVLSGLRRRQRLVVYTFGSLIIAAWTLVRFFTKQTIFDLVSQQVIVHQWLHGSMSAAHMGQTAYVLKMLLLYAPLDMLPGSPRLKLIALTLLINVATFVLIGLVLEKLLREFGVRAGTMFHIALLWLSVIAGSVFWIEFANSRNLEVVGGLWWTYLGLRYLRRTNWQYAVALIALGGVVFFSDPLQVYMSAGPLLLYVLLLTGTRRMNARSAVKFVGVTAAGYLLARLLFVAAAHWLQLSFNDTGSVTAPAISLSWIGQSLKGTAEALVSLFAGAADAGRLRELANVSFLIIGGTAFAYTLAQRSVPRRLTALVACILAVDSAVYIASGQAVQGAATSRYLIMLAPAATLVLSAIRIPEIRRPQAMAFAAVVLGINICTLGVTLQHHWNTGFPQDAHLESAYRYAIQHADVHIYASTDTAMPLLYFHAVSAAETLPIGCSDGRLVRTRFSMDAAFASDAAAPDARAALLFDGSTITNTPNICTPQSITGQLGPPLTTERTDDGSVVLLYPQSRIRLPD